MLYKLFAKIMNKAEIVYSDFNMDRLEQAIKMAADAYESNNEFSKEGLESREQLEFRTSVSIQLFDNAMKKFNEQNGKNYGFIKMLVYRNKLVALGMAAELHLFLEDMLPLLDPEDPYALAFKYIKKQDHPKNSAVFASLLVVHKDHMNDKLSNLLIEKGISQCFNYGFKSIIGCSSNPISRKISLKLGGKLLQEVEMTRNGKNSKLYVLQNDIAVLGDILKIKPKL